MTTTDGAAKTRPVAQGRPWRCAMCDRRVYRLEVTAAAIAVRGTWRVRFHALGACREHQPAVRQQVDRAWPDSPARRGSQVRPDGLAGWAAGAREELLAGLRHSAA